MYVCRKIMTYASKGRSKILNLHGTLDESQKKSVKFILHDIYTIRPYQTDSLVFGFAGSFEKKIEIKVNKKYALAPSTNFAKNKK